MSPPNLARGSTDFHELLPGASHSYCDPPMSRPAEEPGFWEPDLEMLEGDAPLAGTMSLSLTVSQDPQAQPQRQLAEAKVSVLKDLQTSGQLSGTAHVPRVHCSSHLILAKEGLHVRLQGAGGRRCELEGSTWEVGSSDGAAPGPMGLSVVIRLGCPRRVRVMVVGTFKPDAWLEI